MSIVYITIPGEAQLSFARSLHKQTNGKVDLVIIQRRKKLSLWHRFRHLYKTVGYQRMFKELGYALLLRLDTRARFALKYFRHHTPIIHDDSNLKVIEVDNVNNEEVSSLLQRISPDLLVVWGSKILKPHIISTAKKSINLHMGYCPDYRGAIANQFAVLDKQHHLIGATIHYLDQKVDTGDILKVIGADISKSPRDLFRDLNDRAYASFLDIATRIYLGEMLPVTKQAGIQGKDTLLKQWTPEIRYKLGRYIIEWEKEETT